MQANQNIFCRLELLLSGGRGLQPAHYDHALGAYRAPRGSDARASLGEGHWLAK